MSLNYLTSTTGQSLIKGPLCQMGLIHQWIQLLLLDRLGMPYTMETNWISPQNANPNNLSPRLCLSEVMVKDFN